MRRWGEGTTDEALGAVLFFSLCASAGVALLSVVRLGNVGRTDYLLMTLQCALGIAGMGLLRLLDKKCGLLLPGTFYGLFYAFLFCAVVLGEVLEFYYLVPAWDALLHFFSGVMLTYLGFHLAQMYLHARGIACAVAAVCFSAALGAVWECYEYLMDGMFAMNMQKFMDEGGRVFSGRAAIDDTMEDLLLDMLSAVLTGGVLWRRDLTRRG